jgi:acid phosphatase type 7
MSTEHDFRKDSAQYKFIESDLAAVDRAVTPWLVFAGHRCDHTDNIKNTIPICCNTQ